MKFIPGKIEGSFTIKFEKNIDERGYFSTLWELKKMKSYSLSSKISEINISFNDKKGIIRGLHYQKSPQSQEKIIRCINGKIFDVMVDLRPNSKTYLKWNGVILDSKNYFANVIPKGCAHGFQTLEKNSEIMYIMSSKYKPNQSHGIRWNDNQFNIKWPLKPTTISKKDRIWLDFNAKIK
jgi:dTDP-4-dehydrorhamnose 3,5-epimerase